MIRCDRLLLSVSDVSCSAAYNSAGSVIHGDILQIYGDVMKLLLLLCLLSLLVGPSSPHEIRPHDVVTVSEGDNALLPCAQGSRQSIDKFDWVKDKGEEKKKEVFMYEKGPRYIHNDHGQTEQFKDRILFFQNELGSGNASILIQNTHLEDNGTYTCVLFEPRIQEFNIRLNVVGDLKIRRVSGAASVPLIDQIPVENNGILLECKAQGVPKPEVEWRNSAGHSLLAEQVTGHEDASGRFHVKVQVKVTSSDSYTCVITQEDIYHQIKRTVYVRIQDVSTGWIVAGILGTLLFLIIISLIITFVYKASQ